MLTAFFVTSFLTLPLLPAPATDAPARAAEAFVDAERVLAVHEIPGAVVFDLDRAGERFQLTLSLDDDGAVIASAIDWRGPAPLDGGVTPAELDAIDRIDVDGDAVILRGGGASARFAIAR